MQQLQFEASWEKALATKDRQTIEKFFHETKHLNHSDIHLSPIREAINHKGELLVTVVVHNFMEHPLTFDSTKLRFSMGGELIAEHLFTLPMLVIPPKVSMPWTFIFPKDCYTERSSYEKGRLEIIM